MKANETNNAFLISFLSIFINISYGLVFTPILLRLLGQAEFGLYQLMGAFVGYLVLFDLGFGLTVTKYVAQYHTAKDTEGERNFLATAVVIYGILAFLISLAGLVLYFRLDNIFSVSLTATELVKAKKMFIMLIVSISAMVFGNVFTGALAGYQIFVLPRVGMILRTILTMILGIVLLFNGGGGVELTLLTAMLNVLLLITNAWYVIYVMKINFSFYFFDRKLIKEMSIFSFFNFLQSIMGQVYWKFGEFILGALTNTLLVAVYSVAMQLNQMFIGITGSIGSLLLPKATRLVALEASPYELTDFMLKSGRIILTIYALFLTGFILFGKEFLQLWAGNSYQDAYFITIIVVTAALIPRIQAAGNDIARAYHKQGFLTVTYLFVAVLNVIISFFAVKRYGAIGASIGTAIALIIGNVIIANIYYRFAFKLKIFYFFKKVFQGTWVVIAASAVFGLFLNSVINFVKLNGAVILVAKALLFTLLYAFLSYFLGFNEEEKYRVNAYFKGFIRKRTV